MGNEDSNDRRKEDQRWLKVQEQVMNLVSATRENQQGLAKMEMEVLRLAEHVEEVDDHLRGVSGKESIDTRLYVIEKSGFNNGVILDGVVKHVGAIEKSLDSIKIYQGIGEQFEATRLERFKSWLKFWGPVIVAASLWVPEVAKFVVRLWEESRVEQSDAYRPDARLRREIEADKRGERGKRAKKKLVDIESAGKRLIMQQPPKPSDDRPE